MIHRKKLDVDIIQDVLEATLEAYPASAFIQSLLNQYRATPRQQPDPCRFRSSPSAAC